MGICRDCRANHARPRPRCLRCGLALALPGTCIACLDDPPAFAAAVAAVDYAYPWDRLVGELKFAGRTEWARPLADLLADALGDRTQRLTGEVHGVIPMPLSPARLAARGYNQAALLARAVADRTGLAFDDGLLLRPLDRTAQAALDRQQRRQNLAGVFFAPPSRRASVEGRSLALVDDVVTTGATAHEAAQTLLRAGARRVEVWAVARTP